MTDIQKALVKIGFTPPIRDYQHLTTANGQTWRVRTGLGEILAEVAINTPGEGWSKTVTCWTSDLLNHFN